MSAVGRACASLVAFVLLLGCTREPSAPAPLDDIAAALPAALRPVFARDLDVEGLWRAHWLMGYDGSEVRIRRTGSTTFALDFLRVTDFGLMSSSTVATSSGGGLQLLAPEVLFQTPIRVLYPARVDGRECLVPDVFVERLEQGKSLWLMDGDEFAFLRIAEAESWMRELEERAAMSAR
jgi:hypothetical protein